MHIFYCHVRVSQSKCRRAHSAIFILFNPTFGHTKKISGERRRFFLCLVSIKKNKIEMISKATSDSVNRELCLVLLGLACLDFTWPGLT